MTDDVDFDGTVEEVKDQIRDLEDPDYQELLNKEKGGKNRKTVIEFIQNHMDKEEVELEEADEEDSNDTENGEDTEEESSDDQIVEEIEEETEGGLLGGVSPQIVLAAGVAGGLVLGLLLGLVVEIPESHDEPVSDSGITAQEAQDKVESIIELQFNDYEFTGEPEIRNGMYYVPTTITQEVPVEGNETETESQEINQNFYITDDGALLFPEQEQFGQVISPLNVDDELQRAEQEQQPQQGDDLDPEDLEEQIEEQLE